MKDPCEVCLRQFSETFPLRSEAICECCDFRGGVCENCCEDCEWARIHGRLYCSECAPAIRQEYKEAAEENDADGEREERDVDDSCEGRR